jgi:hypothetical protein
MRGLRLRRDRGLRRPNSAVRSGLGMPKHLLAIEYTIIAMPDCPRPESQAGALPDQQDPD